MTPSPHFNLANRAGWTVGRCCACGIPDSPEAAGSPLPVLDTRTPWEIAIDELDRIERLDLPEDGLFKEHYTLVADTMRVYVQAMYLRDVSPVDAIDMTTDEIWDALRRSSLDYDDAKLVLDLLRRG